MVLIGSFVLGEAMLPHSDVFQEGGTVSPIVTQVILTLCLLPSLWEYCGVLGPLYQPHGGPLNLQSWGC